MRAIDRTECERAIATWTTEGRLKSFILLDVDWFQAFNDSFGHIEGDRLLEKIERLVADYSHEKSLSWFRTGGDEFAVLVHGEHEGEHIADDLRTGVVGLGIQHFHEEAPVGERVTVSVGLLKDRALALVEPTQVLGAARDSVYRAKCMGRNAVSV